MSKEYRPRLRAMRRHPVTRKDNVIVACCKDVDDAKAIEALLNDIFAAAKRQESRDITAQTVATIAVMNAELNPEVKAPVEIHGQDPKAPL